MRAALRRGLVANRALLSTAGSLLGATAVTSALGVAFWGVAPAYFSIDAIGLAGATIAAMMLLGQIGTLGLQTLLIGELPRRGDEATPLIVTALVVVGAAGVGLGALFALLAPYLFAPLRVLATGPGNVALFAAGVGLTTAAFVVDAALVGLLRGDLRLGRNTVFAAVKLGAVVVAGQFLRGEGGLAIYAAWVAGNALSLFGLAAFVVACGRRPRTWRPDWGLLRGLGRAALGHHALNLVQTVPNTAFSLVVTAILSVAMNGYFNYAWMVASFVSLGLSALTTVLYAVGAGDPASLAQRMRVTLRLSLGAAMLATLVTTLGADPIMTALGHGDGRYARYGAWSLRVFELGIFPLIVKSHYVAVSRVYGRMTRAALLIACGGVLELALAATGARVGGLTGFSVGWLVAVGIEALFMARTVRAATMAGASGRQGVGGTRLPSSE